MSSNVMVNTVELRSMKRVCVQNFDGIGLLVAEIKQYHKFRT